MPTPCLVPHCLLGCIALPVAAAEAIGLLGLLVKLNDFQSVPNQKVITMIIIIARYYYFGLLPRRTES